MQYNSPMAGNFFLNLLLWNSTSTKPGTLSDWPKPMTIQLDSYFSASCWCHRVTDADFAVGDWVSHRCQGWYRIISWWHRWLLISPIIPRNWVIHRQKQCCQPIFFAFYDIFINFCNSLRVGNTGFLGYHR